MNLYPFVKYVTCTIKQICGKEIFTYLISINTLLYIGNLNKKKKSPWSKQKWRELICCIVVFCQEMCLFTHVIYPGFYFSFPNSKRETLLPVGALAFQLAWISGKKVPPLKKDREKKGCILFFLPLPSRGRTTPPQRTWRNWQCLETQCSSLQNLIS